MTTVAGVKHDNDDGTSRRKIIKRCKQGEMLFLEREPRNHFDPNAIRVLRASGEQLGYLTARVAGGMMTEGMAEYLDKGGEYKVVIRGIMGGGFFCKSCFCKSCFHFVSPFGLLYRYFGLWGGIL